MKKIINPIFLIACCVFNSILCYGQGDTIKQYLNYKGEACEPRQAISYRLSIKDGGIWYSYEYYIKDLKIKTKGAYADDNLTDKTGVFTEYNPDSTLKSKCRYVDNKRTGLLKAYNKKGRLIDSAYYLNDVPALAKYSWYDDGHIRTTGTFDKDGMGIGEETTFYDDGNIDSYGKYSEGYKKDSVWTYYYPNNIVSYREYYNKGSLAQSESYNNRGAIQKKNISYAPPEPGYDLEKYYKQNVHFPTGY